MAVKILLLEDVYKLGRQGDVVSVKPGFARNFLVPRGVAELANQFTLRKQEALQSARLVKAAEDKKTSEAIAAKLMAVTLVHEVKADRDGNLYGSVSVLDLIELLEKEHQITLDKKHFSMPHPIKKKGTHKVQLVLSEDVPAEFSIKVIGEGDIEEGEPA